MSSSDSNLQVKAKRITSAGLVGVFDLDGVTTVRAVVEGAGASNTVVFSAQLKGQSSFVVLQTQTGNFNEIIPVDTYDILKIEVTVYDSLSDSISLSAAGFNPSLGVADVALLLIQDGTTSTITTWSSTKINSVIQDLGDRYVRTTRFETISAGTTGNVTIPPEQSVVLDDFGGTVDAVITTISSGRPTNYPAQTVSGQVVATTFDSMGNFALTGTPSSYPVAIVYRVRQKLSTFDDTESNILGNAQYDEVSSVNGKRGDVVLNAQDVGALDAVNALTVELQWDQQYPSFYTENTYSAGKITQVDIWNSALKTIHLFTKVLTYTGSQVTQVQITHHTDGSVLTKNFTYNLDGSVDKATRTYTP